LPVARKCPRCFVELKKLGTLYLSNIKLAFPTQPLFAYECPKCKQIELVKVEE